MDELQEGWFGTSEADLAKAPPGDMAGDYYKKLVALKSNPQWKGQEALIQKRIEDLINRINLDKGVPVNAQGQAEPQTDFNKFKAANPTFGGGAVAAPTREGAELDRIKHLSGL